MYPMHPQSRLRDLRVPIGNAIRLKRKQCRLTQADLCSEIIGMEQSTLSRIERGEIELDLAKFRTICEKLGCDTMDVFELAESLNRKGLTSPEFQITSGTTSSRPSSEDAESIAAGIQGSGEVLWCFGVATRLFWATENFRDISGRPNTEICRSVTGWHDLFQSLCIHKADRVQVKTTIRQYLSVTLSPMFDFRCRLGSIAGEWKTIRIRGRILRDSQGRAVKIAGSLSEIPDTDFFASQVIDRLPGILVFAKNTELQFTYVNKALCDAFKKEKSEIIGSRDADHNKNASEVQFFKEQDLRVLSLMDPAAVNNMVDSVDWAGLDIDEEVLTIGDCRRYLRTIKRKVTMPNGEVQMLGIAIDATNERILRKSVDQLLRHTDDVFYIKNLRHEFVFCNMTMAKVAGAARPEDMVGKTDFDVFPRDLAEQWRVEERRIIETREPVVNVICVNAFDENVDGDVPESRLVSKYPVVDNDGKVVALVGWGKNITSVELSRRAISSGLARPAVSNALGQLTGRAWVQDEMGVVTWCSESFASFLSLSASEVCGRNSAAFWGRASRLQLAALWRQTLVGRNPLKDVRLFLELRTGTEWPCLLSVFPLLEKGTAVGVLCTLSDFNDRTPAVCDDADRVCNIFSADASKISDLVTAKEMSFDPTAPRRAEVSASAAQNKVRKKPRVTPADYEPTHK